MKYLVVGLGKSGIAAARLLKNAGRDLILFNSSDMDADEFKKDNPDLKGLPFFTEVLPEECYKEIGEAVLSPGVPLDIPFTEDLKKRGIRLSGEVELAYEFSHTDQIAAVTGTNGKTTTTALTGHILKEYFKDVRIVGNIGIPYTSEALTTSEETRIAVEVSSFQLETIDSFHPKAAAILNITPDHLNRHHTMENYIAVKESIVKNQTCDDTTVLNFEDPVLREFGKTLRSRCVYFSSKRKIENGIYYDEDRKAIFIDDKGSEEKIIDTDRLQIIGAHNYENACAAIALTMALGVPVDVIRKALPEFTAVEHRIEFVCEKKGVRYYDDSKGTNPDAAIKAVLSMPGPVLLIGGGYDKGNTYDEWVETFPGRVKRLVLIGATRDKIADCCKRHGFSDYEFAKSLTEAIDKCALAAESGDDVLLSPACASWDMFANYETRGDEFKDYVRKLAD
ncbi:MAG: UDP-N-acetylmuramoyl-L-alanine--D-glutamate ligase [Lachnospiraceae bacterium]|nr:UDP-N-acetylmuramoyl-L-alanine--D-glutamate ligase [Lachnospiraceae bacterium]